MINIVPCHTFKVTKQKGLYPKLYISHIKRVNFNFMNYNDKNETFVINSIL